MVRCTDKDVLKRIKSLAKDETKVSWTTRAAYDLMAIPELTQSGIRDEIIKYINSGKKVNEVDSNHKKHKTKLYEMWPTIEGKNRYVKVQFQNDGNLRIVSAHDHTKGR